MLVAVVELEKQRLIQLCSTPIQFIKCLLSPGESKATLIHQILVAFFFVVLMYLVNEGNQKVRENLGRWLSTHIVASHCCQVLKMFHSIPSERKVTDAESKLIIIHKSITLCVCI